MIVTERERFIIPIVATGKRAMLDFPDVLDFGNCPVKYLSEKPVMIRNIGEKTTKWFLRMPPGFDVDRKEGLLENGKAEQIVAKFYPHEAKPYRSEAVLSYDNLEAFVTIQGNAQNSSVYLSKSHITMDEAYISLQTQQTLQIVNKSKFRVDFQWRAFQTEKEETEKKGKLRAQLDQEEAEERMLLKELVAHEHQQDDLDFEDQDDSDEEEKDEKANIMKRQKK